MQQPRRRNRVIIGVLALGLLAGVALTAHPAQAVDAVGPYYAEPAWDQQLPVATRFVVLTNWGSKAVLDKETGLVWEKSPDASVQLSWDTARAHCANSTTTGNRKGWRLPSVHELGSLIDPSVFPGPTLPPGHPFLTGSPTIVYWSATTLAVNPVVAWVANFNNGELAATGNKSFINYGRAWCVRGGMNADQY